MNSTRILTTSGLIRSPWTLNRTCQCRYSDKAGNDAPEEKKSFLGRFWRGKSKSQSEVISEEDRAYADANAQYELVEAEEKAEELMKKRNKSRLRYSDRLMMYGQPPLAGVEYEMLDIHRSQKYKKNILGLFGAKATGISPNVAWFTKEDLEDQREYEKLYRNNKSLKEAMEEELQRQANEREKIRQREAELDANRAKMDQEVEAWNKRLASRQKLQEKEQETRKKILAELRAEYGYDVDPRNPAYADKYAEKAKQVRKAEREAKKAQQALKKEEYEKRKKESEVQDENQSTSATS